MLKFMLVHVRVHVCTFWLMFEVILLNTVVTASGLSLNTIFKLVHVNSCADISSHIANFT